MKKRNLLLAVCALAAGTELFALRPGELTQEPACRIRWVNCSPFPLGPLKRADREKVPEFRALVFLLTRDQRSGGTIEMLDAFRRANRDRIVIAVVTPDSAADAAVLFGRYPDSRLRVILDSERKLTPLYMAGSLLYPMAFLIDADGKILWCGEAVDLPEAATNCFTGKLDVAVQKKVAPLIDEMQQRMRSNDERPMLLTAEKIFKLDPGNPTALRMRLFSLESRGDAAGAWKLLQSQIKAAPQLLRLYFTALDMMQRYPELRKQLPEIAAGFFRNAAQVDEVTVFCQLLLERFADDAAALAQVQEMLHSVDSGLTPAQEARFRLISARLAYLLCDLDGAIRAAEKAVAAYRQLNDASALQIAEKQLTLYREIVKLRAKKP